MPTVVVGGHSRNVGKTAVTAALIRAFREYPWTAIKISSHQHGNIQAFAHDRGLSAWHVYEETNRDGASDTSRFLAAGAARSYWMRMKGNDPDDSLREILPFLRSSPFVIIESNRILSLIQPDVCIMVLRFDIREFKESARHALSRAHAAVVVNPYSVQPQWEGVSNALSGIPQFAMRDPQTIPAELIEFVRLKLRSGTS